MSTPTKKPRYKNVQCSFAVLEGKKIEHIRTYAGGFKFRVDGQEYEIFGSSHHGAVLVRRDYQP